MDFDGVNDSINEQTISIDSTNFSVSFYTKYENHTINAAVGLNFGPGSNVSYNLVIYPFDGSYDSFRIYSRADGDNIVNDSSIPIFDTWTHYLITSDGSNLKVYQNGQLVKSVAYTESRTFTRFQIGRLIGGTQYYKGGLSNIKLFSTALTAAQVADLYNNPEKIVPTGVSNDALKLWLPMQEGAGTTAYDGSGNGNHGTISGATYTHGIGAPVSQTAVIDWNKGTNMFNSSDWEVSNATTNATISSSSHSAPNGTDTAAVFDDGTGSTYKRGYKVSNTALTIGQVTASTFVKKKDVDYINVVLGTDGGSTKIFALVDLVNGTINDTDGSPTATSIQSVGDGWYYVSVQGAQTTSSQGITYIYGQDPTNGSSVDLNYTGSNNETYIWGINIQNGPINNVHLPTTGALQSSEVLLPAGLTTGRDITGVNLFENVRKQGALNLDGNSWAEVHDNASLDFGTGEFSLEAWVRAKYVNTGSAYNIVLSLGGNMSSAGSVGFFVSSSNKITSVYNNNNLDSVTVLNIGDWYHVVVNYNGTHNQIYINGAFDKNATRTAADITNALAKQIGRDTSTARYYKDCIAQPRIYNRALTAEEVQRNYNAGKNIYTNS